MKIVDLLAGLNYEFVSGEKDIEINNPQYDSRKVQKGDVFFAITGFSTDGHKFIAKAVENGAKVVIVERDIEQIEGVTYIKVENGRKALAMASCNFYDHPSRKMKLIGITGTNGKTTSAFMIKAILEASGYKVGLIGTIANYIGSEELHAERTTPESLELQELFNKMVEAGVDYCVMEVSSHSLDLYRVYGTNFEEGIFTNLTQDHLDFHKTFENYYKAKAKLFDISKNSIINADDEYGERLIKEVTAKEASKVTTYSIEKVSDLRGEDIDLEATGMIFDLEYKGEIKKVVLSIPGRYNVYNALGCIGAALNQGIDIDVIIKALAMVTVPGRCEL